MKKLSKNNPFFTSTAGYVVLGLVGVAVGAYYAVTRSKAADKAKLKGPKGETHWDATDEASWESFPASDPPSNW